ncbi:MAG: transposase, partial [Syntrophales bacterium]|nr:transposase [Syntrophales bacterium]
MMGRMNPQLNMSDMDGWFNKIPKQSFWYHLRVWSEENVHGDDFAHLFSCTTGRSSIPPQITFLSMFIMLHKGYSYREMPEVAMFDDRAKYALGLSRSPEYTLTRSTLNRHHQIFMEDKIIRKYLKKTLQDAVESGMFEGCDSDLVDSFMVAGATSRRDTYTLIIKAVNLVLKTAVEEDELSLKELLQYNTYDYIGKPKINWNDETEKQKLIEVLVLDARRLNEYICAFPQISEELKSATALLKLVSEQDVEEKDGNIQIARKTCKDRIISVTDPEMRHGRKTSSQKSDGYKGHILAGGKDHSLITATAVTAANVADSGAIEELLDQRAENISEPLNKLSGDTAYGGAKMRIDMQERNIELVAKVPPATNPKGHFTKDEFAIDLENNTITCPANHTIKLKKAGSHKFAATTCNECSLRSQCTSAKNGRVIVIHEHEAILQKARREQETPDFKEEYRLRPRVERVIENQTVNGARNARYYGKQKTGFQLMVHAVIHNFRTVVRYLEKMVNTENVEPAAAVNTT